MNIVGIIVVTLPDYTEQVATQIATLDAQIHYVTENGQLVITIEHEHDEAIHNCIAAIQTLTGVLSATLVYHQVDTPSF
ncbi:MAG: hypothetical protein RL637_32 [Pseudomonadota bacterium]|jgi:nitrate reductase NapD